LSSSLSIPPSLIPFVTALGMGDWIDCPA
jgi:hypothetical protein